MQHCSRRTKQLPVTVKVTSADLMQPRQLLRSGNRTGVTLIPTSHVHLHDYQLRSESSASDQDVRGAVYVGDVTFNRAAFYSAIIHSSGLLFFRL